MDDIRAPYFDGTQPCRQMDTDLFFPEEPSETLRLKAVVKPVCSSCRFVHECLEWALDNNEVGIWGGTTDSERLRMSRKRRKLKIGA